MLKFKFDAIINKQFKPLSEIEDYIGKPIILANVNELYAEVIYMVGIISSYEPHGSYCCMRWDSNRSLNFS